MRYVAEYHHAVRTDDVPSLSRDALVRIQQSVTAKLLTQPDVFGRPLRRSLKGYRALRVGDYRIVFCIVERKVRILAMRHRKDVYSVGRKRVL